MKSCHRIQVSARENVSLQKKESKLLVKKSNPSTDKEPDTMNSNSQNQPDVSNSSFPRYRRMAGKRTRKVIKQVQKFQPVGVLFKRLAKKSLWGISLFLCGNFAFAANADGYAFTGALFNIMNELKGAPIAIITAIGIIAAGFFWVFKGHEMGQKQVICALVGGGLVIAAPTLVTMVPGMTGAVI